MLAERQPGTAPPSGTPRPSTLPTVIDDASLFFDFDGTLVDLAPTPEAVVVGHAMLGALDALAARLPGRVAIVSGRSVAQLDALLGDHARRLAVAGSHGAERRVPGDRHVAPAASPALAAAAAELAAFADLNDVIFEAKSFGAALHYRQHPERADAARAAAAAIADTHGLVLQHGKMMVEVRAPGDKGAALTALMQTSAMAGTRPIFFGDDVTDEDGFAAAAALGGVGVLIGAPRETAARYRIDDVAGLQAWIAGVLAA